MLYSYPYTYHLFWIVSLARAVKFKHLAKVLGDIAPSAWEANTYTFKFIEHILQLVPYQDDFFPPKANKILRLSCIYSCGFVLLKS